MSQNEAEPQEELRDGIGAFGESRELLEAIVEGSRDAIFLSDEDSRFLRVNSAACDLTGYSKEELLEMRIPDLHEDVDLEAYHTSHASIMAGQDALTEAGVLRKDGTKVPTEFNNRRITVGGAFFMHTVARDITEWKRAQEELSKSESELRTILESTVDGILVVGENGKVVHANKRFAKLWQIPQELIDAGDDQGLPDSILQQLEDPDEFLEKVQALNDGTDSSFDTIQFKDGKIVERYSRPLVVEGQLAGRVWSFRDVTERKRAEEELNASRDRLRKLAARLDEVRDEERTSLARELHDDVGQNLTALRMDLALLGRELPTGQKMLANRLHLMIDVAQDSIDRVNRMSSELQPPILEVLGLKAAIENEVGEYRERWGAEIVLELDVGKLEASSMRDRAVTRILKESLSNVRQHAQASQVEVILRKAGEALVLEVLDDGIGITDDQLQDYSSFGLIGMQERVERLGGTFVVQRGDEGGTRVSAVIPIAPERPESAHKGV